MTLFALGAADDLLALRFARSPLWETQAAVQTFVDGRAPAYHEPWHRVVRERVARLDVAPLLAVLSNRGFVPDFLTPPPRSARPRLRDELADICATPPALVVRELERCRQTVTDERHRRLLDSFLADPAGARDVLATRLLETWNELVAPFWVRIRTLLDHDIEQRSLTLARHGLRRVLDELHPRGSVDEAWALVRRP